MSNLSWIEFINFICFIQPFEYINTYMPFFNSSTFLHSKFNNKKKNMMQRVFTFGKGRSEGNKGMKSLVCTIITISSLPNHIIHQSMFFLFFNKKKC